MSTQEYDPFDDDLPRVQIPLGADRAGLTIDGEFMTLLELPEGAREAYIEYAENGGEVRIWQCQTCGYLSDAKALHQSTYNQAYECGGCGERLRGTTQNRGTKNYKQVYGPVLPDEGTTVDPNDVVPDTQCPAEHGPTVVEESKRGYPNHEINDEAAECDRCVPNHPSHLGKLQNRADGLTQGQMMKRVAEAVRDFREA